MGPKTIPARTKKARGSSSHQPVLDASPPRSRAEEGRIRQEEYRRERRRQERERDEGIPRRLQEFVEGKKHFIQDKGFTDGFLEHDLAQDLRNMINTRGWAAFTAPRAPAVTSLVREFYAAFPYEQNRTIMVRGVAVPIGNQELNQFLGIPTPPICEYRIFAQQGVNAERAEQMRALLQKGPDEPGWILGNGRYIGLKASTLNTTAKAWWYFMVASVCPTICHHTVRAPNVLILYAILSGLTIDVGSILYLRMRESATKAKTGFFFPGLITEYCKAAGVQIHPGEEMLPPSRGGRITESWFAKTDHPAPARPQRRRARAQPQEDHQAVLQMADVVNRLDHLELSHQAGMEYIQAVVEHGNSMWLHIGTSLGVNMTACPSIPLWQQFQPAQPQRGPGESRGHTTATDAEDDEGGGDDMEDEDDEEAGDDMVDDDEENVDVGEFPDTDEN